MLKLILKREDPVEPPPLSGQRVGYTLTTDSGVFLTDIWQEGGVPWVYVNRGSHNMNAATPLHALELGIASAARWIAVEILKKTKPPKGVPEEVSLWLAQNDHAATDVAQDEHLWIGQAGTAMYLRVFMYPQLLNHNIPVGSWCAGGNHIQRHLKVCASREQALAVIIEYSAPWIAAALAKEIGVTTWA